MLPARLIITQSEKGGCGKTTIHEALVAGLTAAGRNVRTADADDGNSGYIRRCGKVGTAALAWSLGSSDLDGWLDKHLGNAETLTIDCGANIIASGAPVNGLLGDLVLRVNAAGGKVVTAAIASPNAPGSDRLVREMRDAYGQYAHVIMIKNDQDKSGSFPPSLTTLGMATAMFPHVSPGVAAARMLSVAPLIEVLRSPPPNHAIAMAAYAERLHRFFSQAAVSEVVGPQAATAALELAAKAPGPIAMAVFRLDQATDAALTANHSLYVAREKLHKAARSFDGDLAAPGEAAIEYVKAEAAYRSSIGA